MADCRRPPINSGAGTVAQAHAWSAAYTSPGLGRRDERRGSDACAQRARRLDRVRRADVAGASLILEEPGLRLGHVVRQLHPGPRQDRIAGTRRRRRDATDVAARRVHAAARLADEAHPVGAHMLDLLVDALPRALLLAVLLELVDCVEDRVGRESVGVGEVEVLLVARLPVGAAEGAANREHHHREADERARQRLVELVRVVHARRHLQQALEEDVADEEENYLEALRRVNLEPGRVVAHLPAVEIVALGALAPAAREVPQVAEAPRPHHHEALVRQQPAHHLDGKVGPINLLHVPRPVARRIVARALSVFARVRLIVDYVRPIPPAEQRGEPPRAAPRDYDNPHDVHDIRALHQLRLQDGVA
mmetsp:Transcript_75146/g.207328  ORF Transcript_75146/g.207328 Transcript_75146/m.207328 type:complete len:364 (-) Transcript_75146:230-1321(-)